MSDSPVSQAPSFLRRIPLAFSAFFSILADASFAARLQGLRAIPAAPAPAMTKPAPTAAVTPPRATTSDAALQLLALFQRDARLLDFCEENIASHADADIGAAARLVHEGCRKVLREHFTMVPVRLEPEGSRITLNAGFDAAAIKLTGNVLGTAPFKGTLVHCGWRVSDVRLPTLTHSHDASVCAQAEVEL